MNRVSGWAVALLCGLGSIALAAPVEARDHHRDGYGYRDGHGHRDSHRNRSRSHDRRDDRGHRDYRDHDRHAYRPYHGGHDRGRSWESRHPWDRRNHGHDRVYVVPAPVVHYRHPPRHVGPPPWARGRYVHHYERPVYVIGDYRGYGLRHPPRGHRWYRDDYGDYLLVAIASGLIADLVLHH